MTVRLSRRSSPASIEEDLAGLWRDAAHEGPVARAVMANLVVYFDRGTTERVDLDAPIEGVPIDEVALRHPARVIVLHHSGRPDPCGPVAATISVLLSGPPGLRVGVEEIALRSTCAEASLPSIVRRLSLGDIPTCIWWAEDLSRRTPLDALITMGRQLVYDSSGWADIRHGVRTLARLLSRTHPPKLSDLNWRRLAPMRQALQEASDALALREGGADPQSLTVRVRHRPGDEALAWLVAGWLDSCLHWRPDRDWPVTIEPTVTGAPLDHANDDDEVLAVRLGADIKASMNGHRVLVNYKSHVAPFSVAVPRENTADAIADELRTLDRDTCLRDTVAALARRFNAPL